MLGGETIPFTNRNVTQRYYDPQRIFQSSFLIFVSPALPSVP